ncbi:hypothetical protein D3C71_244110 [compost metagenome]
MSKKFTLIGALWVLIFASLSAYKVQAQTCPRILSIYVDACTPNDEGYNELFTFQVGTTAISNYNNIDITWATTNNPFNGFIKNTTTASKVTAFNNAIINANGCGRLIEPTGTSLPANAKVVVFTSQNVDPSYISFGALAEDMYVLFHNNPSNTNGYFANNGSSAMRYLTLETANPSCSTTVGYNRASLANADGASVSFNASGTPAYLSNGCVAPVNTSPGAMADIALASGSVSTATLCRNTAMNAIVFNVTNATGAIATNLPPGVSGSYNSTTNQFTLSGTPTTAGLYNYKVKTTGGCGADSIMATLAVTNPVTPVFTQVPAICSGTALAALPTQSTNGITGTWSPAINNTSTTTYTFTPNANQCAGNTTMTITVNPVVDPVFTQVPAICAGAVLSALPTQSNNGILGTWSPALNNAVTTTYTFTPDPNQCAVVTTMTIQVNNNTTPVFTQVAPICAGTALAALPTQSTNGITGTWSPALNNAATTTYTFTPNANQCAGSATLTISVNPLVDPVFTQVPAICAGAVLSALPTQSTNGITGSWSPALNNTATTTYTFTPTAGQCAATTTMTITVNPVVDPVFTQVPAICAGAALSALPTQSANGITGSWSPAINNISTTTYTFTPNANQCAGNTTMTITVNPVVDPTFTQVPAICSGATLAALPTQSTNGITGTWSPAINNTATTTYTFTPTAGQCAATTTMTITVNPVVDPVFTQVPAICAGATLAALPTQSTNGITGSWSPALNNAVTTTYIFTPDPNQCAVATTMTIPVNNNTTPTFTQVPAICAGATLSALSTQSNNGITGTWSPALNNAVTTTYTFTPDPNQCAVTTTMTIQVNNNTTPTFTQVPAICAGAALSALPTQSNNGITGSWSPAINNTATTTYTFTPNANQCAGSTTMTITVNPVVDPVFTQVPAICAGAILAALPTQSTNGITGSWSPALNNTATTTYTFTPTAGQCAATTTMTITVNPVIDPVFTQVPTICVGTALAALPTQSTNGISGTWSPALNNAATTTYTFTPNANQCAGSATMTITVNPLVDPVFTQVPAICAGAALVALPTQSTNGITGTWSPAINNTATTTYTFTPDQNQCAVATTMTIQVNNNTTPTFTQVAPICAGAALAALPTQSTNGITGTWSPALNNTATTTYTFTPAPNQCAVPTTMTIQVNNNTTPTFTQVPAICAGAAFAALPTQSTNGITGSWLPALNNAVTTTYTFTPTVGQCAAPTTMTITVNPILIPTFTQVAPICAGTTLGALPTQSNNGITGTWSPALNNMATTTYTFTPGTGQCAATATMSITVNPPATPAFNAVSPVCIGSVIAPLPTNSNNGISGTWSPALDNTTTTTYTFTPAAGQCAGAATMTIVVQPHPLGSRQVTICAGSSYTFNGVVYTASNHTAKDTIPDPAGCDSIITLDLTVLPVNAITTVQTLSGCGSLTYNGVTYTQDTQLKDTLRNQYGCDSIYRVTQVVIYPQNGIARSIDTVGCDRVAYNGKTYYENTILKDTLYTSTGCDSLYLTVNIRVEKIGLTLSVAPEDPYEGAYFTLKTDNTSGIAYEMVSWSPASLFNDQYSRTQQIKLNQATSIRVVAASASGCMDTATVEVNPRPYRKDVMMPNAFTPNGDGKNDVFAPVLALDHSYNMVDFRVFNRWGQVLHATSNINSGWDGTFKGAPQEQGVYYYTLTIYFMDGTKQAFKGDLMLIR